MSCPDKPNNYKIALAEQERPASMAKEYSSAPFLGAHHVEEKDRPRSQQAFLWENWWRKKERNETRTDKGISLPLPLLHQHDIVHALGHTQLRDTHITFCLPDILLSKGANAPGAAPALLPGGILLKLCSLVGDKK